MSSLRPLAIIPARLASSRLPRKALLDLAGEPMVVRVLRRIESSPSLCGALVVTDSDEIHEAVSNRAGRVILSRAPCASGTERVARCAQSQALSELIKRDRIEWDGEWLINVQGDEPLLPLSSLESLTASLSEWKARGIHIVTLAHKLPHEREAREAQLNDPSAVKVCVRSDMRALIFSRAAVGREVALRHIGVYALHISVIETLLSERSALSIAEDLEQLTWLERGEEIGVVLSEPHPKGVDTPDDLERTRRALSYT